MTNTYVTALVESLEKKNKVLDEIIEKNKEQRDLLSEEPFSFEKFDKNTEEKGVLIYRLNQLDEGFESLYEKVKAELDMYKDSYADKIRRMQELIREITDKSTSIQAEEARNKAALEQVFKSERDRLKSGRSGVKALKSYSQAMNFRNNN
ncbi:MAG: flagellar export chaperone FlgN [Lachnospiraceae bacterium]|nr:flagellar export chaperone FlgN [Lachnospiraceae bacterium]